MINRFDFLWFLVLITISNTLWAYGSSSSTSCAKPEFTSFVPADNATVTAGAAFSFFASANTLPDTIRIAVKGVPTIPKVSKRNDGGFQVASTIPSSLRNVYARISITADGKNNCKGDGGWLVKIAE